MSISLGGELYLTCYREDAGPTIFAADGRPVELKLPGRPAFAPSFVQRFADGGWLAVEGRTWDLEPNAHVFGPDGRFSHAFFAGDGIETVLVDVRDRIWVGYSDEGIFGAGDYPPGHAARQFGPNGLVRLDDMGRLEFTFKHFARPGNLGDLLADDRSRKPSWLCALTGSSPVASLVSVEGQTVEFALDRVPDGTAISVGSGYFALFGGYDRRCMVTVVECASQRLRLIQLRDRHDSPLVPSLVATRGTMGVVLYENALYRLDLDTFIDALGLWDDGNSTTVHSAVRYMEEEFAYAPASLLTLSRSGEVGVTETPVEERPPENQPRDDCQ